MQRLTIQRNVAARQCRGVSCALQPVIHWNLLPSRAFATLPSRLRPALTTWHEVPGCRNASTAATPQWVPSAPAGAVAGTIVSGEDQLFSNLLDALFARQYADPEILQALAVTCRTTTQFETLFHTFLEHREGRYSIRIFEAQVLIVLCGRMGTLQHALVVTAAAQHGPGDMVGSVQRELVPLLLRFCNTADDILAVINTTTRVPNNQPPPTLFGEHGALDQVLRLALQGGCHLALVDTLNRAVAASGATSARGDLRRWMQANIVSPAFSALCALHQPNQPAAGVTWRGALRRLLQSDKQNLASVVIEGEHPLCDSHGVRKHILDALGSVCAQSHLNINNNCGDAAVGLDEEVTSLLEGIPDRTRIEYSIMHAQIMAAARAHLVRSDARGALPALFPFSSDAHRDVDREREAWARLTALQLCSTTAGERAADFVPHALSGIETAYASSKYVASILGLHVLVQVALLNTLQACTAQPEAVRGTLVAHVLRTAAAIAKHTIAARGNLMDVEASLFVATLRSSLLIDGGQAQSAIAAFQSVQQAAEASFAAGGEHRHRQFLASRGDESKELLLALLSSDEAAPQHWQRLARFPPLYPAQRMPQATPPGAFRAVEIFDSVVLEPFCDPSLTFQARAVLLREGGMLFGRVGIQWPEALLLSNDNFYQLATDVDVVHVLRRSGIQALLHSQPRTAAWEMAASLVSDSVRWLLPRLGEFAPPAYQPALSTDMDVDSATATFLLAGSCCVAAAGDVGAHEQLIHPAAYRMLRQAQSALAQAAKFPVYASLVSSILSLPRQASTEGNILSAQLSADLCFAGMSAGVQLPLTSRTQVLHRLVETLAEPQAGHHYNNALLSAMLVYKSIVDVKSRVRLLHTSDTAARMRVSAVPPSKVLHLETLPTGHCGATTPTDSLPAAAPSPVGTLDYSGLITRLVSGGHTNAAFRVYWDARRAGRHPTQAAFDALSAALGVDGQAVDAAILLADARRHHPTFVTPHTAAHALAACSVAVNETRRVVLGIQARIRKSLIESTGEGGQRDMASRSGSGRRRSGGDDGEALRALLTTLTPRPLPHALPPISPPNPEADFSAFVDGICQQLRNEGNLLLFDVFGTTTAPVGAVSCSSIYFNGPDDPLAGAITMGCSSRQPLRSSLLAFVFQDGTSIDAEACGQDKSGSLRAARFAHSVTGRYVSGLLHSAIAPGSEHSGHAHPGVVNKQAVIQTALNMHHVLEGAVNTLIDHTHTLLPQLGLPESAGDPVVAIAALRIAAAVGAWRSAVLIILEHDVCKRRNGETIDAAVAEAFILEVCAHVQPKGVEWETWVTTVASAREMAALGSSATTSTLRADRRRDVQVAASVVGALERLRSGQTAVSPPSAATSSVTSPLAQASGQLVSLPWNDTALADYVGCLRAASTALHDRPHLTNTEAAAAMPLLYCALTVYKTLVHTHSSQGPSHAVTTALLSAFDRRQRFDRMPIIYQHLRDAGLLQL